MTIFAKSLGIFDFFFLQKCLLSSPPCFTRLLSKSLDLIGRRGDIKGKFLEKKIKILLLRNRKEDEAESGILAKDIALYKSYVFYSGRIRTLVAMATYSFHRLIMGKVEI